MPLKTPAIFAVCGFRFILTTGICSEGPDSEEVVKLSQLMIIGRTGIF